MVINRDYTQHFRAAVPIATVVALRNSLRINRHYCRWCEVLFARLSASSRLSGVLRLFLSLSHHASGHTRIPVGLNLQFSTRTRGNISSLTQGSNAKLTTAARGFYDRRYLSLRGLLIPFRYRESAFISLLCA